MISALREKINKAVSETGFGLFLRRYAYLFIFAFNLIVLDLVFRIVYRGAGYYLFLVNKIPILFTLMWCLILTGIAWILPGIIKRIYIVLITSFMSFLCLYCGKYTLKTSFSFADMMFADDGARFFFRLYLHQKNNTAACLCLHVASVLQLLSYLKGKYKPTRIISSILAVAIGIVEYS